MKSIRRSMFVLLIMVGLVLLLILPSLVEAGGGPILFGDPDSADTQGLLRVVRNGHRPFPVVALGAPAADEPAVPLLRDRGLVDEQAAAYVCRDFACLAPETEPSILQTRLAGE